MRISQSTPLSGRWLRTTRGLSTHSTTAYLSDVHSFQRHCNDSTVSNITQPDSFVGSVQIRLDHPKGLVVYKARSKTDQQGEGKHIEVGYGKNNETCAVIATRQWLKLANITEGPVFVPVNKGGAVSQGTRMSGRAIARVVKKHVTRIGRDAGHSLRRGFATEAARKEVPDRIIAQTTGHASTKSLDPYIANAKLMVDPPNAYLDL